MFQAVFERFCIECVVCHWEGNVKPQPAICFNEAPIHIRISYPTTFSQLHASIGRLEIMETDGLLVGGRWMSRIILHIGSVEGLL